MQHEAWYIVVMWLICTEVEDVLAAWERTCTPFTKSFGPHPRGICGRRIDETLSLLCMGDYYQTPSYYRRKRELQDEHQLRMAGVLISRGHANSFLVKRSDYHERGIVCECCYHRCNIREMFQYCRNGPGLFGLFKRSAGRSKRIKHLT